MAEGLHDEGLVERFQRGEEAAFREVVERHADYLARRARQKMPAVLARRIAVSDVVQDACLGAYLSRDRFEDRGEGALRAWLGAILDNKLKEVVRRHVGAQRRTVGREEAPGDADPARQLDAGAATPSQTVIARETTQRLRRAMEALPEGYRTVLRLRWQEHLSHDEVARRLNRSYEAVRKLHARALRCLKERLDQTGTVG